jgi:hypothetical protein
MRRRTRPTRPFALRADMGNILILVPIFPIHLSRREGVFSRGCRGDGPLCFSGSGKIPVGRCRREDVRGRQGARPRAVLAVTDGASALSFIAGARRSRCPAHVPWMHGIPAKVPMIGAFVFLPLARMIRAMC